MGVWIETYGSTLPWGAEVSHPVWVCGLKLKELVYSIWEGGHTLYGCVDWNCLQMVKSTLPNVTPCMGVWIETETVIWLAHTRTGHTLYGCVDWNTIIVRNIHVIEVTPCMGVWIETGEILTEMVAPDRHTLYGCVDWNWSAGM